MPIIVVSLRTDFFGVMIRVFVIVVIMTVSSAVQNVKIKFE